MEICVKNACTRNSILRISKVHFGIVKSIITFTFLLKFGHRFQPGIFWQMQSFPLLIESVLKFRTCVHVLDPQRHNSFVVRFLFHFCCFVLCNISWACIAFFKLKDNLYFVDFPICFLK